MSVLELLSAREHMDLYSQIKGLTNDNMQGQTEYLLDKLNIHADKDLAATFYSGGNKRKLMVAVAMLGNPTALFLDEPSTGMDPEAKRSMWGAIKEFKGNSSVLLTTHSMDEAE